MSYQVKPSDVYGKREKQAVIEALEGFSLIDFRPPVENEWFLNFFLQPQQAKIERYNKKPFLILAPILQYEQFWE